MVNVRKIGAIATGALFLGATFGMASAVTVPSAFQSSMLAAGGVAKAQLVVGGSGADGKIADTQSAEIIQAAVAANLAGTVGGDISIEFGSQDLDDDDSTTDGYFTYVYNKTSNDDGVNLNADTMQLTASNVGDGRLIKINEGLRFDGNTDNDLKDTEDYVLYNHVYVLDASDGNVQFAYKFVRDTTYSITNEGAALENGEVVKIKGEKYVVTDADTSDQEIELGQAITKTLTNYTGTQVDPKNAVTAVGTLKLLFDGTNTQVNLYDGNEYLEGISVSDYVTLDNATDFTSNITSDAFLPYRLYVMNLKSGPPRITMVENSQLEKLSNNEEGAMGFYKVKINDPDFPQLNETILLGDPVSLIKEDTIDMPDTYYQLKFTIDKYLDIKRKKTDSIESGTKLKYNLKPGKNFLDDVKEAVITVSTTGGEAQTEGPTLDIVDLDEGTADTSKNLVLIGGPVANTMTAELVENTKSKIVWDTSDGDIEVISNAFSGKYGIIVAGKERAQTKAAADALAANIA